VLDFLPDGRLNDDVETTGVDGDNHETPQNWKPLGSKNDDDLDSVYASRHWH